MNVAEDQSAAAAHLDWIRRVFAEATIAVPVEGDSNCLVFAQKDSRFEPRWKWLLWQARRLRELLGLEFPAYLQQLKRCYDADPLRRAKQEEYTRVVAPRPLGAQ
jgi:hypothetical protein